MEALVKIAKEKTPGALTESDLERIRDITAHAVQLWSEVKTANFAPQLFGFDASKVSAMRKYLDDEGKALTALRTALHTGIVRR